MKPAIAIPVFKPKLPEASAILPYMERIDKNRWYANFGPLLMEFEKRLADMLGQQATMVANGTLGLTVALQALEVTRGGLCIMPSWTFTATPAAALAAGLEVAFIDVDRASQAVTPERVKEAMKQTGKKVSAVIPVCPFGSPIDVLQWDRFTEETGIPVVIDAAAAFDSLTCGSMEPGRTPVMISMHATKICGIGEGGLLVTTSNDTGTRIRRIINFGFEDDHLSHRIAINAKPSEYDAAVGLAMLDEWDMIRAQWAGVQQRYIEKLEAAGVQCWMHKDWVTSSCNIVVPEQAIALIDHLAQAGIDARRWWRAGCHSHPAYRECEVIGELSNTYWLGQSLVGLPAAIDLSEDQQDTVCEAVHAFASGSAAVKQA